VAVVDAVQVYLRVIRGSGEPSKYNEFTGLAEESIARLKTQPASLVTTPPGIERLAPS